LSCTGTPAQPSSPVFVMSVMGENATSWLSRTGWM